MLRLRILRLGVRAWRVFFHDEGALRRFESQDSRSRVGVNPKP